MRRRNVGLINYSWTQGISIYCNLYYSKYSPLVFISIELVKPYDGEWTEKGTDKKRFGELQRKLTVKGNLTMRMSNVQHVCSKYSACGAQLRGKIS